MGGLQLRDDEVLDVTGFRMPEGDYETIAGLLLDRLGEIPEVGATLDIDDWQLEVTGMDRHRIAEVTLRRRKATPLSDWLSISLIGCSSLANAFFVGAESR